jgi:hypothetical protein
VKYNEDTLAYEDYILKRNTAMSKGNMIIIDNIKNLHDIANQHADYSNLANYNNLMTAYKDRFCIPIGVGYRALAINNEILRNYDISIESNVISYYDYLKLIQQMKEKGAKFKPNLKVLQDIINYYMIENGIRYLDEKSEILNNKTDFKAAIKKTLVDICEDFKLYNNDTINFEYIYKTDNELYDYVYDEVSGLTVMDFNGYGDEMYSLVSYSNFSKLKDDILNTSFVADANITYASPCAYMYKKVTNDKTYDVFNQILDESYFKIINPPNKIYAPVIDTEEIRKHMEVDENWEHNGLLKAQAREDDEESIMVLVTVNDALRMLVKDKDKAKHLADTYYSNNEFYIKIYRLIFTLLKNDLVNNGFNYNKKEVDDIINKQLEDFVLNFNIHYN